jgi:hypothetical protein
VDRLTTGRRHARAGSVTVTELLSRQAPTLCTDSSPTTRDDDSTDTIPVVVAAAAHRREPARGAQLAKLASLGVAGVVLCGAVTISSMIAHQRREAPQAGTRPVVQITGEEALLPDQLGETVPQAPTPTPPRTGRPAEEDRAEPAPATSAAPTTPAGDSGDTTASGGGVTSGPVNDLALVREFYDKLPDAPGEAFGLLAPELLDASLGEFREAWSKVTSIDFFDVVQRADGILATVRMSLADGGRLRVEQLLTVAESPRRIVGVQLLSAQRN